MLKKEGKMKYAVLLVHGLFLAISYLYGNAYSNDLSSKYKQVTDTAAFPKLRESIRQLNEVIAKDPKNAKLYYQRAQMYLAVLEIDSAIKDLNRAIQYNPCAFYYNERGFIYAYGARRYRDEYGNLYIYPIEEYGKAIEDFTKALEIDPNNDTSYYRRGQIYHALNQWDRALRDYKMAAKLGKHWFQYYACATILFHMDSLKQAYEYIQLAEKSINKTKEDMSLDEFKLELSKIYAISAVTLYSMGNKNQALSEYRKAMELNPNWWKGNINVLKAKFSEDILSVVRKLCKELNIKITE